MLKISECIADTMGSLTTPQKSGRVQKKTNLIVFKTHLDVGFTDYAEAVKRGYFEKFIPAVLELARKTRGREERYVWTTGSWLVYRYLEEASPTQRKKMEEAIEHGDFHWHALPFTTHSEIMPKDLFRAGLMFSKRLDARFGRSTKAAKMTDVPGHTRGIVPILADAGVELLHIGINPASTKPQVPGVFRWRCSGSEITTIYESEYGASTLLPGGSVLSVNLTNDNLGPHSSEEIVSVYSRLKNEFQNHDVRAGSLDDAADLIKRSRTLLPVVDQEIGDTWIHGVASDPAKLSRYLSLARLRSRFIMEGAFQEGDDKDLAFSEPLLLLAEHTWGMDIKTHLEEWEWYTPAQLDVARTAPPFVKVMNSWHEQRRYVEEAISALPEDLRSQARSATNETKNHAIRVNDGMTNSPGEEIAIGPHKIVFDEEGAVTSLVTDGCPVPWIGCEQRLGIFNYETFSASDYERFHAQYNTQDLEWVRKDFQKWGMPLIERTRCERPRVTSIRRLESEGMISLQMEFSSAGRSEGAPDGVSLIVIPTSNDLRFHLNWRTKSASRLPEAIWYGFNPDVPVGNWVIAKMGVNLSPFDVVVGGNRSLHGCIDEVSNGSLAFSSEDCALVCPGKRKLLDFDGEQPDLREGIHYNLYNNIWGTNFPLWSDEPGSFRFRVRFKS